VSCQGGGLAGVLHYSVMSNHLHLLVEAPSRDGLTRGLQGLARVSPAR
jgi:REP element-mobilizing transposase RayT